MFFLCDLRVLAVKLASSFGHPTQVSTQVELASTCDYLPVRLARALSLGQTNRQVVASGLKLNLHRDVHWVAKRLASFLTSTRRLSSILLANNRLMDVTQLALT